MVHHEGFGDFSREAAPDILMRLRAAGIHDGTVVELGCGSGILAGALIRAGFDVVGYDQSAALIDLARRQAPTATFHVGSLYDAELPTCVAVVSVGECLNYLQPGMIRRKPVPTRLFQRVFRALRPGGMLLFDLATPRRARREHRHVEAQHWSMLLDIVPIRERDQLVREIVTFSRSARGYERSFERHRLQLYRPSDVLAVLRSVGFRSRAARSYGEHPFPRGLTAFVARVP